MLSAKNDDPRMSWFRRRNEKNMDRKEIDQKPLCKTQKPSHIERKIPSNRAKQGQALTQSRSEQAFYGHK
jgi:hypothetical protein